MTSADSNFGKQLLREGDVLDFYLRNLVKLQDQQDYFILEDPSGHKHFIEAGIYNGYGLEVGCKVECRVDRINCTGRIFLEPRHPFYTAGKYYDFPIIDLQYLAEKTVVQLEDVFLNRLEIEVFRKLNQQDLEGKQLRCKVIKIKKGKPEVEIAE